jgi:SAM-dependent MidA family methyltransferase
MRKGGFREKLVSINGSNEFTFITSDVLEKDLPKKRIGTVLEISPPSHEIISHITKRIEDNNGAALIIDYGYKTTVGGNTLQSVKGHDFTSVLKSPGEADITAHVDFKSLRDTAIKNKGVEVYPIVSQRKFLSNMCLRTRLKYLLRNCKNEKQAMELKSAVERLINPDQMGKLFKVMGICHKNIEKLSGF